MVVGGLGVQFNGLAVRFDRGGEVMGLLFIGQSRGFSECGFLRLGPDPLLKIIGGDAGQSLAVLTAISIRINPHHTAVVSKRQSMNAAQQVMGVGVFGIFLHKGGDVLHQAIHRHRLRRHEHGGGRVRDHPG